MRYRVVVAEDSCKLEAFVNEFIEKGWEPQGGVSVSVPAPHWSSIVYAQAMINWEETDQ